MNNLLFVIGQAGTGKTTVVLNKTKDYKGSIAYLAYTNSAVDNLKRRMTHPINPKFIFSTLHKFFRIGLDDNMNNKIIYNLLKDLPDIIVIDEFGLIPFDIYHLIVSYAKDFPNTRFILMGDILQLQGINKDNVISNDLLDELPLYPKQLPTYSIVNIIKHLSNSLWVDSIFRKSKKLLLTEQHRFKEDIFKDLVPLPFDSLNNQEICLSSRKKYLKRVGLESGLLSETQSELYPTKTILGYLKNNEETITYANGEITPKRLLTIHKSQGDEYESVVVVLDDISTNDICAYYTALTRAKRSIRLAYFNKPPDLEQINNAFNDLKGFVHHFLGSKQTD